MKKYLVLLLTLVAFSCAWAGGPFIGMMADVPLAVGYTVGYAWDLTPIIDIGVEYMAGSFTADFDQYTAGVKVGTIKGTLNGNRIGGYVKFDSGILPLKLHVGSQTVKVDVAGAATVDVGGEKLAANESVSGIYYMVGLDYKVWVLNVEPYIGNAGYGSYGSNYCGGLRLGIAF